MEKQAADTATPVVMIPKAEAIEKIAKLLAAVRVNLIAAKTQMKAAVSPERYALKFQADAFKKQANFWKAQIARLKKEPKTEVNWTKEFGA